MNQRVQRGRNLSASYEREVTQLNSRHKNGSWTIATSIAGLMEEGALRAVPTVTASSRVSRYACAARHCGWVDVKQDQRRSGRRLLHDGCIVSLAPVQRPCASVAERGSDITVRPPWVAVRNAVKSVGRTPSPAALLSRPPVQLAPTCVVPPPTGSNGGTTSPRTPPARAQTRQNSRQPLLLCPRLTRWHTARRTPVTERLFNSVSQKGVRADE